MSGSLRSTFESTASLLPLWCGTQPCNFLLSSNKIKIEKKVKIMLCHGLFSNLVIFVFLNSNLEFADFLVDVDVVVVVLASVRRMHDECDLLSSTWLPSYCYCFLVNMKKQNWLVRIS